MNSIFARVFQWNLLWIILTSIFTISPGNTFAQKDSSFYSNAFETERFYRIYLPSEYDANSEKEYPVVYYFHGWGGRYKWDNYVVEDDPDHLNNGRMNPPFVMEWLDYSQNHDVIIVTWDGYEPKYQPGTHHREGIDYGGCRPYDLATTAFAKVQIRRGWDYGKYFRDLVMHIDRSYRTLSDRDHRAITGLSMGGLTSLFVTGQNKDLVSSLSTFCPADNIAHYGSPGNYAIFPVLEMYRSLQGIPMRLTATDGDWLHAHDLQMKRILEGSGFESFEFHEADFPDHWAADIDLQLDFHMAEFGKAHPLPDEWSHIAPGYNTFDQWGYTFNVKRADPAITILENISKRHMKVFSRTFIPDGPLVSDEIIRVSTDSLYGPSADYKFVVFNLTDKSFTNHQVTSASDGRLKFNLPGGGNIFGIHGEGMDEAPDLQIVDRFNRDYLWFEAKKPYALDFSLVNVGLQNAENITVTLFSDHPYISFADNEITIPALASAGSVQLDSVFSFDFSGYSDENLAGNLLLEVSLDGLVTDTQKIVFFTTPESAYIEDNDVIVLDGRSQSNVPVFEQGSNSVQYTQLSGGSGNGNGIPENGEEVLVYIKLEQGLSPKDKNSFHRTHLIGAYDDPYVGVSRLKYDEKKRQAGATSVSTYISINDTMPDFHEPEFWFRVESLYNEDKPKARRPTYEFKYDYRRLKIPARDSDTTGTGFFYSSDIFKNNIYR